MYKPSGALFAAYLPISQALPAVRMGIGAPEIEYKEAQNDSN
jgi:hypothetical protein